jgi:outer membrane protein assembly factor BamA
VGGTLVGGRYSASYDRYTDRDLNRYSFDRWAVDLQQYVPIFTSSRSIVLRARAEGVTPEAGNEVPFYLQPALGGSHSMRGLRVYRLRDRNALLLQAEYRWNVNAFMAGSLFYDAGKVTFDRRDLDFDNLKHDYGFGLRLGFLSMLAIRAEVVLGGGEGKVFALRFGDVF